MGANSVFGANLWDSDFKAWCLSSRLDYMSIFDIYQSAAHGSSSDYEEKFGKDGGTLFVLLHELLEFIPKMQLKFYFENCFTGLPLINNLTLLN